MDAILENASLPLQANIQIQVYSHSEITFLIRVWRTLKVYAERKGITSNIWSHKKSFLRIAFVLCFVFPYIIVVKSRKHKDY